MHPQNAAVPQYLNPAIKLGGHGDLVEDMNRTYALFEELAREQPNLEVRRITTGCLHEQIVRHESTMLVALLLYAEGSARIPLLECTAASPLYHAMLADFDTLWKINSAS